MSDSPQPDRPTSTEKVRRHRATSGRVRLEIQARSHSEAAAIRQFVSALRSRLPSVPDEPTDAVVPSDLCNDLQLTPTARAAVEEFAAALDNAPPAIIERGVRMSDALSDAARRLREARAAFASSHAGDE